MGEEKPEVKGAVGADGGREAAPRHDNQPAAAPVIALRMEGLLTWVAERVAKFPRDHRFTVGDRFLETCLEVTGLLVEASYRRGTSMRPWPRLRAASCGRACSHGSLAPLPLRDPRQ